MFQISNPQGRFPWEKFEEKSRTLEAEINEANLGAIMKDVPMAEEEKLIHPINRIMASTSRIPRVRQTYDDAYNSILKFRTKHKDGVVYIIEIPIDGELNAHKDVWIKCNAFTLEILSYVASEIIPKIQQSITDAKEHKVDIQLQLDMINIGRHCLDICANALEGGDHFYNFYISQFEEFSEVYDPTPDAPSRMPIFDFRKKSKLEKDELMEDVTAWTLPDLKYNSGIKRDMHQKILLNGHKYFMNLKGYIDGLFEKWRKRAFPHLYPGQAQVKNS